MNSNDKLLEQIFNLSDRLDNLEKNVLEQQRIIVENANKDLLLKQQEMAASVKEMELSIHNTILAEVGKIMVRQLLLIQQHRYSHHQPHQLRK